MKKQLTTSPGPAWRGYGTCSSSRTSYYLKSLSWVLKYTSRHRERSEIFVLKFFRAGTSRTFSRSRETRAELKAGFVDACRAIGARVRWLHRLGAVSTTRLTSFLSWFVWGRGEGSVLVTLVAPKVSASLVAYTGREIAYSGGATVVAR